VWGFYVQFTSCLSQESKKDEKSKTKKNDEQSSKEMVIKERRANSDRDSSSTRRSSLVSSLPTRGEAWRKERLLRLNIKHSVDGWVTAWEYRVLLL